MTKHTCFSCGYEHEKVEAQGMWHCPNALCMGVGGVWFRYNLNSYKEISSSNEHTVDEDEWLAKGILYNIEHKIPRSEFYQIPRKEKKFD